MGGVAFTLRTIVHDAGAARSALQDIDHRKRPGAVSVTISTKVFVVGGAGFMAGGFEGANQELGVEPDGVWGPRVTLSFENAPLAYPDTKGYKLGGDIVPELFGGAFVLTDRAEAFLGAGVRFELKIAQYKMGLLEISARGAAYLAMRGMVVGDERRGFAEFGLGEYWIVGKSMRIGFEGSLIVGREDQMDEFSSRSNWGGVVELYFGWGP